MTALAENAALREEMGTRARNFVVERFAKRRVLGELLTVLDGAARRRPVTHLLVLEPEADGHPLEWLQHLVGFLRETRPDAVVTFVVADELFAPVVKSIGHDDSGRCASWRSSRARWHAAAIAISR